MVWKETSHTSSTGDSATFAAEDINKISRMLNGSDVDDVTIGLDWTFGSGKLNTPNIKNTGTLTLPTSTDTLVGRATTDTLTNNPSIKVKRIIMSYVTVAQADQMHRSNSSRL